MRGLPTITQISIMPAHTDAAIKISVITIVRNGQPFVAQTIHSVISQDYPNLEYIVIDGGSTDGTLDVIRSNAAGITRWISEPDSGIADAFNKGVHLAGGDYLLTLNADDALADNGVLRRVAEAIVHSDYPVIFYGDGNILERHTGKFLHRVVIPFSEKLIRQGHMLPHPCMFTHRSYFEKYGDFDTSFRIAMDYEWLLRGVLRERVVHSPLLVTNIRSGGISTRNRKKVIDEIVRAQKKNGLLPSPVAAFRLKAYFMARYMARSVLEMLGLYAVFDAWRKWRAKAGQPDNHGT